MEYKALIMKYSVRSRYNSLQRMAKVKEQMKENVITGCLYSCYL